MINIIGIALCFICSLFFFFYRGEQKYGLYFLIFGGFLLRLYMSFLDPYLHDWDERYHALVAKNIMTFPFKPMLILDPVLHYNVSDWCCNHVWVHKQPLFLWQIALSLKLFGVNEIAVRIPSVIMGTLSIMLIYKIGEYWQKNSSTGFIASFLFSLSFFNLELTSGRFSLDHNDIAFSFYVTCSIWAFVKYIESNNRVVWSILIGVFSGLAILNKWLPGLIIYSGWFIYACSYSYIDKNEFRIHIKSMCFSIIACMICFIPWQLYTLMVFPIETKAAHQHNLDHIVQVLGNHSGDLMFHLNQYMILYSWPTLFLLLIGIWISIAKVENKRMSASFLAMILVFYLFFSLVSTKMPAFTYPMNSLIWIIIAVGLYKLSSSIKTRSLILDKLFCISLILIFGLIVLNPSKIIEYRSSDSVQRENKVQYTEVYKNIEVPEEPRSIVINCIEYTHVELMFYKDIIAYHYFPNELEYLTLKEKGYKFYSFKEHKGHPLPKYILEDRAVKFLEDELE